MCIIDQTISTSVYISQIEQHIQMMQHLLQGLKYADSMARARNHSFMRPCPNAPYPGYPSYPGAPVPGFGQPQPGPYSGFGGTPNTATQGEAFKFFDQHKEALDPIQKMFNQSMGGGFANLFGTAGSFDQRTGAAINETQWVADMSPGKGGNFEFKVQSAAGINFAEMTIDELARKTANNGVLNHLINMVTTSPKGVNGSAWRVDGGRIVITIDNLGSFVCDENILPILRLTRPILDLRTKPMPVPDTTPPTANFLITRVLGKHSNVGDFEIEGYVTNDHPHKLSQTVISIIDLPMYISYPNGLQPTKEHPRTAWILSPNAVLTLLDIDGVLMNEVIKLKDLGEYPNVNVVKDFCEGIEPIDPFPVGEKVDTSKDDKVAEEDLREVEITRFSNIRQDLTKWLASSWSIDSVESIDEDGITGVGFNLIPIDTSNRHKLEITDNYLVKWFDLRTECLTDGRALSKIVREMSDNLNVIATIVSFEEHNGVIVQVLRPDNTVTLYTTDLKRGKSFIEATKDLNSRWINVVTVD